MEVCLKAMENNHDDIVKATEKFKNKKEMTFMMQEMYFIMKGNSSGHGNQSRFECPKGTDVATDCDIKVVKTINLKFTKQKKSYILKLFRFGVH